jgi:hypothetical protein
LLVLFFLPFLFTPVVSEALKDASTTVRDAQLNRSSHSPLLMMARASFAQ